MGKDAVFTMKLESDLRDQFLAAAEALDRPASQIVREFMREFIQRQRETREHDAWFRDVVEQAMREADDPTVTRISHEDVRSNWRQQRAELVKRGGGNRA
jgi:predicted transcriptional regulator